MFKLGSFLLYLLIKKPIFSSSDLSSDTKQPKVLMCCDFQQGIRDDEKDMMFITQNIIYWNHNFV
jgi:hypothetical protein